MRGGLELRTCAGCKAIRYCSAECQKEDWASHKTHCTKKGKGGGGGGEEKEGGASFKSFILNLTLSDFAPAALPVPRVLQAPSLAEAEAALERLKPEFFDSDWTPTKLEVSS